tara:strand:- start:91 stop:267 length:177 start_codon:yes stop_codon:yes gene_type:complete
MADEEKKETKKESKKEKVDYTVWHPDHMMNHTYELEDGRKVVWTMKSNATKPRLLVLE